MRLVPEGHCNVSRGGAIPGAAAEGAAQRADAISRPASFNALSAVSRSRWAASA